MAWRYMRWRAPIGALLLGDAEGGAAGELVSEGRDDYSERQADRDQRGSYHRGQSPQPVPLSLSRIPLIAHHVPLRALRHRSKGAATSRVARN